MTLNFLVCLAINSLGNLKPIFSRQSISNNLQVVDFVFRACLVFTCQPVHAYTDVYGKKCIGLPEFLTTLNKLSVTAAAYCNTHFRRLQHWNYGCLSRMRH